MTFKSDLKNLQNIHASELLHKRLGAKLSVLPIHKRGFNISLITFRLAIIGLLLVLLSAPATGILFAAKGSQRGNPFFRLKRH